LLYEQALLFRSTGMREEALSTLENLLILDGEHLGALALQVELRVQSEDWRGAVESLRALAAAPGSPNAQQRIARIGAADFLEGKLGDPGGALDELLALTGAGLADLAIDHRVVALAEQAERWDVAVATLGRLAEAGVEPSESVALLRRAARIHDERRADRQGAIEALALALTFAPTDVEAAEELARLLDDGGRRELSGRFEAAVRRALAADPTDPDALRKLRRAAGWRGDASLDHAALAALVAMGLTTPEESSEFAAPGVSILAAAQVGVFSEAPLSRLVRVAGDGDLAYGFAALASETVAEMDGLDPAALGLGRGDVLGAAHPLCAEVVALCARLDVPPPEVWQGGREPQRIDVLPHHKGRAHFVFGSAVQAPLGAEQRWQVARLALGVKLGVAPFLRVDPARAASTLFAFASAGGAPLAAGEGRPGMTELSARAQKVISRATKKLVPEHARPLGDGRSIDLWARAIHQSAARAGLMGCGDLRASLRLVLGRDPSREAVAASAEARDLLTLWLAPDAGMARQASRPST
jgi:tetratricopeptide (TPR) repeat protein